MSADEGGAVLAPVAGAQGAARAQGFAAGGTWRGALNGALRLKALQEKLPDFLSIVPLLAPLSAPEIKALSGTLEIVRYKDRANIITQGDIGVAMFILMEGTAEVIVDGVKCRTYTPTDFFGEIAMLKEDSVRTANVRSAGESVCVKLTRHNYSSLVKVAPIRKIVEERAQHILDGHVYEEDEQHSVNMIQPGGGTKDVPVTAEVGINIGKVLQSAVFNDWVKQMNADQKLFAAAIHIQSVDMFGPRIGFVKFKARALLEIGGEEGENNDGVIEVPGIVFMRGGAVGVLVILECDGVDYTILTRQARVPCGISDLPEIPAGMLDGSGHFRGVAAEEIQEECHIVISEDELVDMTELAYADKWKGMIPSAGGCDEFIKLYMFRRSVEKSVIEELEGRLTGLPDEGERIKLHLVKLHDLWKECPDAKALSALTLFSELKREGLIPERLQTGSVGLAELASPPAHEAFGGHAHLEETAAPVRPSSRASNGSSIELYSHSEDGSKSHEGSSARGSNQFSSFDSKNSLSGSRSVGSDGDSASKDDSHDSSHPSKKQNDDSMSQMSSSAVMRGGITTRHRGRRAANSSTAGSNKPLFQKLQREISSWKKKHAALEEQNAKLLRQLEEAQAPISPAEGVPSA